jgi:hypothetical protein
VRRAALLVVAVVFAGCGGGDDRLSRDEYASKADTICAKYQRRTEGARSARTTDALARAADRTLAAFEDATRELEKLNPPESEEELVRRWFAQLDVLKQDVERIRDRARAGDLQGVRELAPLGLEHNRRANQLAARLGMRVCSEG